SIWDVKGAEPGFAEDAHGFAWLDDLAAVGDAAARARAQDWTWDWIFCPGRFFSCRRSGPIGLGSNSLETPALCFCSCGFS
ncbi:MAG: hypothetical protein AAB222_01925, partial [Candidatus Binatota bacterium]